MILNEIAAKTIKRIEQKKSVLPQAQLEKQATALPLSTDFPFEQALQKPGISFICEVKKASPSKGVISRSFPYLDIAREYEQAGANAISVLTEPYYFLGNNQYLEEIAGSVQIPVLRKDFVVDPYMVYEAKVFGASAVLLICSLLTLQQLKEYLSLCHFLGLSALVEAHTKEEIHMAVEAGARIIGVNNRNLQTFSVDFSNSLSMREFIPSGTLFVAESGIQTHEDICALKSAGVDGVLVGEILMRSQNKRAKLAYLKHGI